MGDRSAHRLPIWEECPASGAASLRDDAFSQGRDRWVVGFGWFGPQLESTPYTLGQGVYGRVKLTQAKLAPMSTFGDHEITLGPTISSGPRSGRGCARNRVHAALLSGR